MFEKHAALMLIIAIYMIILFYINLNQFYNKIELRMSAILQNNFMFQYVNLQSYNASNFYKTAVI